MRHLLQSGIPTTPDQFVDQYGTALATVGETLLVFAVAFLVLYTLSRVVLVGLTRRSLEAREFKPGIVSVGTSVAGVVGLVASLALAATVAGFGAVLVAFATLGAALALAVGFATQDLISNFVAGVFILKDEPFETGDWIEWNGNVGVVREIDLRTTTLDSFDNERITVPNGDLANSVVVNPVGNDTLRVSYEFGVSYDTDVEHARHVVLQAAAALDDVLEDPAPSAPVVELGDSAVVLSGRVWIDPRETGAAGVKAAFVEAVKGRFDEEAIEMPYPHTELTGDLGIVGGIGESQPSATGAD